MAYFDLYSEKQHLETSSDRHIITTFYTIWVAESNGDVRIRPKVRKLDSSSFCMRSETMTNNAGRPNYAC